MRKPLLLLLIASISSMLCAQSKSEEKKTVNVKKITPVLYVNEVEPSVDFWVKRFGFQKTVEVPDGSRLGFAIVQKEMLSSCTRALPAQKKTLLHSRKTSPASVRFSTSKWRSLTIWSPR